MTTTDHDVSGHLRGTTWYLTCDCGWHAQTQDGNEDPIVEAHLEAVADQ